MRPADVPGLIDAPDLPAKPLRRKVPNDEEPDLRGYVSRRKVAEMLEMSVSGVRKYEDDWFKGHKFKYRNTTYYPRRIVEEFMAARGDKKAHLCFAAFRAGRGPSEVMASMEEPKPALVQLYYQQYLEMRRQEESVLVVELDPGVHAEVWLRAHGFEALPSAQYIRAALEFCSLTPGVHAQILRRANSAEERLRGAEKRA
jgi:hypothetical protein